MANNNGNERSPSLPNIPSLANLFTPILGNLSNFLLTCEDFDARKNKVELKSQRQGQLIVRLRTQLREKGTRNAKLQEEIKKLKAGEKKKNLENRALKRENKKYLVERKTFVKCLDKLKTLFNFPSDSRQRQLNNVDPLIHLESFMSYIKEYQKSLHDKDKQVEFNKKILIINSKMILKIVEDFFANKNIFHGSGMHYRPSTSSQGKQLQQPRVRKLVRRKRNEAMSKPFDMNVNRWKCRSCPFSVRLSHFSILRDHMNKKHGIKNYRAVYKFGCRRCGNLFRKRGIFCKHQRIGCNPRKFLMNQSTDNGIAPNSDGIAIPQDEQLPSTSASVFSNCNQAQRPGGLNMVLRNKNQNTPKASSLGNKNGNRNDRGGKIFVAQPNKHQTFNQSQKNVQGNPSTSADYPSSEPESSSESNTDAIDENVIIASSTPVLGRQRQENQHKLLAHLNQCYRCICGFTCPDWELFCNHLKVMNSGKIWKCVKCSHAFYLCSYLENHMLHDHQEQLSSYECRKCGDVFDKDDFIQHNTLTHVSETME